MVALKTIFGSEKVVDAPVLNRLGLQIGRTLLAAGLVRRTRWPVAPELEGAVAALRSEGFVELPGLFTPEELDEITEAAVRANASPDVLHFTNHPGGNRQDGTWRSDMLAEDRAVLDRFFLHPTVREVLAAVERVEIEPGGGRCTVQNLVQQDGAPDLEAEIHSDTFHATYKAWLYLSDVTVEDGPLVFYPRSQRLSPRVLREVYRASVRNTRDSRAISDAEIAARGVEPKVFTCARGTVVIANTFGYHGRIQGAPPGERLVLHIESRPPPFRRADPVGVDGSSADPAKN